MSMGESARCVQQSRSQWEDNGGGDHGSLVEESGWRCRRYCCRRYCFVVVVGVVVVVVSQIGVKATWEGVTSRDLATGARASKSPPRRVHAHRT